MFTIPQNFIKKNILPKINNFEKFTLIICLIISLITITAWIFKLESILNLVPNSSTMKFNTALIFLFAGINLILYKENNKISNIIYILLSTFSILIGVITLLEYFGVDSFQIDNLFVLDSFTKVNPGRMSSATAVCSLITGIGFLGLKSKNDIFSNLSKFTLVLVVISSMIAIICFVLAIPVDEKPLGFGSMAIHTALLFLTLSLILIFKSKNALLNNIKEDGLKGTLVFHKVLPSLIIFPIVPANILMIAISQSWINIEFGIVTYTVVFIPISIMYIAHISLEFNKTDIKRKELEVSLINKNLNLTKFNQALDLIAIVAITDENGIIKYVNDSFCEISKYSREELIGKTHKIIKSDYHDNDFFKSMWTDIKAGKIWVGEVKNKAKDNSHYWVDTTIIPFKNDNSKITGYIAIRQDITKTKKS